MKKNLLLLVIVTAMIFQVTEAQTTKIIAHRGAWKNTKDPQNSIASMKSAVEQKAWGTEFDVHLTKDDVLILNHDNDHFGIDIGTSTYEELAAKKLANGEVLPKAEDFLKEALKQKKTKLVFELKTSKLGKERTIKSAEKTIELINKLHAQKQTEYIAFDYDACLKLKELAPKSKVHYLMGDKTPSEIKAVGLDGIDYHLSLFKKNPTWIKEAKDLKLKTNVWTVNSEEDMQYFIDNKIDYITTDEPELLNKLLKK